MKKKSKLDFFVGSNTTTPAFTALNSGYESRPVIMLTKDDWDSPLKRTNISFDKPSNSSGGSFADPYASWPGKILTVEIKLHSADPYVLHQNVQKIKSITQQGGFISIRRTTEFPDQNETWVEWLKDCYFTDVAAVEIETKNVWKYAFVFTSKNKDTTTPVITTT